MRSCFGSLYQPLKMDVILEASCFTVVLPSFTQEGQPYYRVYSAESKTSFYVMNY